MEKIICPICKGEDHRLFCQKNDYDLHLCKNCNLVFVWPPPNVLDDVYSKNYFHKDDQDHKFGYTNYDQDKEMMRPVFVKHLDHFSSLVEGRKIFDIGSATGYFLDLAKQRGWDTYGIDISDYASQLAREKGHRAWAGKDLSVVDTEDKFDIVTMWDVLEHLPDPLVYLKELRSKMVEDSVLAVNTIDRGSLWAKMLGKRWQLIMPPEHLMYYTYKNLEDLFDKAGFEIIDKRKIGKKFSLPYIFHILHNSKNIPWFKSLSDFFDKPMWRKFAIPINVRDNIFVLVKPKKQ
ncbi:hypothetical protein C0580_00355 [Candidatus Parcubacteria bacterium]|nr:MAG: hypothetical protein C0580_00355 [Candidatus Parcubacteria bacterium]